MLYIQPEGCIPDRYRSTPLKKETASLKAAVKKSPETGAGQNESSQRNKKRNLDGCSPGWICRENINNRSSAQIRWRTWSRFIVPAAGEMRGIIGVRSRLETGALPVPLAKKFKSIWIFEIMVVGLRHTSPKYNLLIHVSGFIIPWRCYDAKYSR